MNCYIPGYPLNGHANVTEFTLGYNATFSCSEGYQLVGSKFRQCRENGKWSGQKAKCKRKLKLHLILTGYN